MLKGDTILQTKIVYSEKSHKSRSIPPMHRLSVRVAFYCLCHHSAKTSVLSLVEWNIDHRLIARVF